MFIQIAEQLFNWTFEKFQSKKDLAPFDEYDFKRMVGHRGLTDHPQILENTLEAFAVCSKLGASIELDIHLSVDNHPIISHDANTKRVFKQNINIHNESLSSIQHMEPKVPSLENLFESDLNFQKIFIELKDQGSLDRNNLLISKTIQLANKYQRLNQIVLISLDIKLLELANLLFPHTPRAIVYLIQNKAALKHLERDSECGILGWYFNFPSHQIEHHRLQGLGQLNYRKSMNLFLKRPVPYLFTDRIDKLCE